MKRTLFSLLACATLAAPTMANGYWTGSITLSLPALDTALLHGDGDYSTEGSTGKYNASNTSGVSAVNKSISVAYLDEDWNDHTINNIPFVSQAFSGDNYVVGLRGYAAYTIDDTEGITGYLQLTVTPTAFNGLIVNGYDYTNAILTSVVNIDAEYTSEATATVSTWKVSGATEAKTPEPATATLSLLALAGLAARRRRH